MRRTYEMKRNDVEIATGQQIEEWNYCRTHKMVLQEMCNENNLLLYRLIIFERKGSTMKVHINMKLLTLRRVVELLRKLDGGWYVAISHINQIQIRHAWK